MGVARKTASGKITFIFEKTTFFRYNGTMHKKAILLFLLFATICVGALTYVNNVFLPVKLKEMIIQETSKKLNRSVSIEDLYYVPLKGLVLKNVIIQDRAPKVEKIFSAQEISISIFYIPLIFQKKIIIPSLVVDDPVLLISRERTGSWNFQDLLTPERKQDDSSSFSAYIAGLTINNGTLLLFDKNVTREAIERIDHIHIRASLSLPQNMKATVKVFPRGQKSLKIFADLNYDFISQDFLCQLRAENIFLENFSEYINRPGLNLKKAKISLVALDLSQRAGKITGRGECVFDAVQMDLQEKNTVTFSPTLTINEIDLQKKQWRIKGRADIKQGQLEAATDRALTSDIIYDFTATYTDKKTTLSGNINSINTAGHIGKDFTFSLQPQGNFNLSLFNNTTELKTQLKLNNAQVTFKPNAHFVDSPLLDLSLTHNPASAKTPLDYQLTLSFANGSITDLPFVKTAEKISGKISFAPNKFSAESLSAIVSQTPVSISGVMENFKDPWVNVDFHAADFNLGAWENLASQYLPKNDIDLKGIATFKLKYKGKLKKIAGSSLQCTASLKDVTFKNQTLVQAITGISGDIAYQVASLNTSHYLPDEGSWKNLTLTLHDKTYTLNGTLKFNNLTTRLQSEDLSVSLDSKLFPDRVKISTLTAKHKQSQATVQGEIFYPTNKAAARLNIKINGTLALEDLTALVPGMKEKISSANPAGLCAIEGLFVGSPQQWTDWALALTLKSDRVSLYGYAMDKVLVKYDQRDRFINNFSVSSSVYGGTLLAQGSSDLSIKEMPYKANLEIKNVDCSKLKNDTPLKDKDIAGTLGLTYAGTGPLADPLLSQGQGFLSIKKGKLWQFDVLKGLAQLLFVPGKENITLDSAEGNFSVVNQKVLIKDALITGNQIELNCNGMVNFKGELDFDIVSRFAEGVIRSSDSLQKTIAAFLTQAEDFLTVKITGTLAKPEYKVIPRPLNVLQKTKDFIFDVLPNIFQ